MIKPTKITEKLLFSTIRLQTPQGIGTGFYFLFEIDENKKVPVFITNKHVINNSNEVTFSLHFAKDKQPSREVITITYISDWIYHDKYDLAFTFASPLFEQIKREHNKDIFMIPLTENLIWDNEKLERSLSAVENVLMYGYPIGLYDEKNVLPLIRSGVTASHPAIDYNGEKIGVVDMACFPGSSGSPILIVNEGSYIDKKSVNIGASRIIFLGILFGGPVYNSEGKIVIREIPTRQEVISITPQMINLGYYIKSEAILDFKEKIRRIIR